MLSPAWGTITYASVPDLKSGGLSLVSWPHFKEKCCSYGQNMPGSMDGRSPLVNGPADMSWLSNFTGDSDTLALPHLSMRNFHLFSVGFCVDTEEQREGRARICPQLAKFQRTAG